MSGKKLIIAGLWVLGGIVASVGVLLLPHPAAATAYVCQPNGTFFSPTTGSGATTSDDIARGALAQAWIKSMSKTRTHVTTSSTIAPSVDQPDNYTGAIQGTFNLQGASYPTSNPAVISVTSPTPVIDSYRGVISGTVLATPSPFRWIIQAYKRTTSGGTIQVPVQALADGVTGAFSIDVSSVASNIPGTWMLGLLDANAGYAPYGALWPTPPVYTGLEVQHLVVTDAIYFWSSVPANSDGTFWFENSNTGTKMFRLVDTSTHDILAEYIKPTGLVRSYSFAPGESGYGTGLEDRSFVYDQGLAVFAALSSNDQATAKLYVDGLLRLQTTSGPHIGGFVFAGPQLSPSYTDPLYRTGAHAIATDALLAYIEKYGSDPDIAAYKTAASNALTFVQSTYSATPETAGLYLGGYGQYSGTPQVFDPAAIITWASTEHNMDIWHMFTRANRVFAGIGYDTKAQSLQATMTAKLYNVTDHRYNQGINGGVPDLADPLDMNTWGAIQLYATNQTAAAESAIGRLAPFTFTRSGVTGFAPFYDSVYYPGALPTVWFEGSFGAALAYYKLGQYDAYRTTINNLIAGQQGDGSFRYATDPDAQYEIGNSKSVAGTAWFILATTGRDQIWNTCQYQVQPATIPAASSQPVSSSDTLSTTIVSRHFSPESVTSTPAQDMTPDRKSSEKSAGDISQSNTSSDKTDVPTHVAWRQNLITWVIGGGAITAGLVWWMIVLFRHRLR